MKLFETVAGTSRAWSTTSTFAPPAMPGARTDGGFSAAFRREHTLGSDPGGGIVVGLEFRGARNVSLRAIGISRRHQQLAPGILAKQDTLCRRHTQGNNAFLVFGNALGAIFEPCEERAKFGRVLFQNLAAAVRNLERRLEQHQALFGIFEIYAAARF